MASSTSSKQQKQYHIRSISFPSGSHPTTLRFAEEINKLKTWETITCLQKAEAILIGLSDLAELYECVQDLLQIPQTQQAQQHDKWVDELLDESIRTLDICEATRNILLQIKESAREAQMALRRRGGKLSIESIVGNYMSYQKNAKKGIQKCLKELKRIETKFGFSPILDSDNNVSVAVTALRDAHCITIFVFQSLLSFLSVPSRAKQSKWSLVSKLLQKRQVVCKAEQDHEGTNEVESVDVTLQALCGCISNKDAKVERLQMAQKRLQALEDSMESLDDGLERVLKCMIQTRVTVLNNLCQ